MSEQAAQPMTLRQKLVQVYREIDAVEKGGKNNTQGYNYVRAVDLVNSVRRALKKLGVYAEINFEQLRAYTYTTAKGSVMNASDVRCTITFYDAEAPHSPQMTMTHTASGLGSASDSGDKYSYKAQTGALKYALRNAFLIPDENDPEADETADGEPHTKQYSSPEPSGELVTGEKPDNNNPASSSEVPGEDEVKGLRNRFRLLGDDLATAGLKASAKMSIAKKMLAYLLQTTGAAEATSITRAQWNTFYTIIDGVKKSDGGFKELVRLVEAASKPKKEEEAEA